jgi:hypothetical protein
MITLSYAQTKPSSASARLLEATTDPIKEEIHAGTSTGFRRDIFIPERAVYNLRMSPMGD